MDLRGAQPSVQGRVQRADTVSLQRIPSSPPALLCTFPFARERI